MSDRAAKQRVLVVFNSDGVGGVERVLSALVPAAAARGVGVDLVCHEQPSSRPGLLGGHLIRHLRPGRLPGLLGRARQAVALRRIIGRGEYAAVIGVGPVGNALVSLTRRRSGPPVAVCECGNPFIELRRTWDRWFGWTLRRADVLVVQTEALARELRGSWRFPAHVAVVRSPVPAFTPIQPPSEGRGAVIAAVGRLIPRKGYSDLIQALARLGTSAEGWSIVVIGDGPERIELELQAQRLGLADRVEFVGTHTTPWELFGSASIFALCSRHEGYPTVVLEAMASGCTIVAADCRFGPSEMIEDGVSGLLYPVGDVDRLVEQLDALIRDPSRRLALAREATTFVAQQTTERTVDRWLELLASVSRGADSARRGPR